jgi:hypothetical protein
MTNAQWFAIVGGMLLTMGLTAPAAATSAAKNRVKLN